MSPRIGWCKMWMLILNCTVEMLLSSFAIIITKQLTLLVTWPFDSSPALYYKWSIVTMHLSCTIMEIWWLKDNGVMTLTFSGHLTSLVMWPFNSRFKGKRRERERGRGRWNKDGLRKVRCTHGHSGDFILRPVVCIALDRQ